MLHYTISKLRDSAEAYRLLPLPLDSPLAATVRSIRPASAWSKAAGRVDQRREITYRNKSKLGNRSQRRPGWEMRPNNKTHTRKPRSRSVYRPHLPIAVIVLQFLRTPNQDHQQKPTKKEHSKITQYEMFCCLCALLYKICRDEGTTLTADCFTLGTSIISTTLMKNLLGAGRGRADRPKKRCHNNNKQMREKMHASNHRSAVVVVVVGRKRRRRGRGREGGKFTCFILEWWTVRAWPTTVLLGWLLQERWVCCTRETAWDIGMKRRYSSSYCCCP